MFYAMFDPAQPKHPVEILSCPMAADSIDLLMTPLLEAIGQDPLLFNGLFEVDFLATLSGEMLVTLIYRKPLDETVWPQAAAHLCDALSIDYIIGRSRKQKLVIGQDFVTETLNLTDEATGQQQAFHFQQIENAFTQPNAAIAQKMLGWAREQTAQIGGDLLELYCGNGHFSIALADRFERILATEISRSSVKSAQYNFELNQVDNIQVVKLAADEVAQALQGREFRRLADLDLTQYAFSTLLVDPPRAGLDELTRQFAAGFEHILYISCNPDTLARDLAVLGQTHEVVASALFDQFPYTAHIESGVMLKRKAV